jgi:putrescine transport system substrate-binding protein
MTLLSCAHLRPLLLTVVCVSVVGCSPAITTSSSTDENVVNVYNWADYIAPDTVEKFEAEYGIKVNYDIYDGSQVVDVKLLAGNSGYDVGIHSSQYSSRLTPIGIYEKLDYSRLDNTRHLDLELRAKTDVYEKTNGYTIPYHWGTTGYAWNVKLVRERLPDHPMDSMDVLFDPEIASKLADCGISLLDGPTDIYPMVLTYLGLEPNAVDDESLAAAEAQLMLIRPYIRYFSNQKMQIDLPTQEVCVAMSWSGDYATAARRAKQAGLDLELRYTMPKEGSGLWVDGIYMPADAPHKDNAYLFMNFLMRPDIAADIANEVSYGNVNKSSWALTRPDLLNDPAIYPPESDWQRLYPILAVDPKRERFRTRSFARVKSGI